MNIKGISFYLSLFSLPISFLAFFQILFSSYFDYFLNLDSYTITLFSSLLLSLFFFFIGRNSIKKIDFHEQIILMILIYFIISILISIPYYLSNYQIPFINSLFEAFSGITGTGFTIFKNVKYLDPTLILWRSFSQWIGGLYFLIFLLLFFSNTQFNYKLNNLVYNEDKSLNLEKNIRNISIKIFFLYSILTLLIYLFFSIAGVRLFNGLNLSMTLISTGGFLPTNTLSQIIKTNFQEIILIFSFLISLLNIYLIFNIFKKKNFLTLHHEDGAIISLVFVISLLFTIILKDSSFIANLINVLSSIGSSGISNYPIPKNFSLFFLTLTIIGGSIISTGSGIKFLRIYILLKATTIEIFKLVKPNNIVNQKIFFSNNNIEINLVKLSFLVFISFFLSLFALSSILLFDNLNFEDSFKLSILTLTNTTTSSLYGLSDINFSNLLTSSKLFIIIFMIIGKIELISIFLIIKKIFFKN